MAVISILLVAGLLFGGCRRKADDGRIELRVINYFSMANPAALEELNIIWDAFDRANPNIRVVREDDMHEPFHHKMEAYAAAGNLPDVMLVWPSGRSSTLHAQRLLKDLGPLIRRDGLDRYFTPVSLDPSQQFGGYLAMITRGVTATNAFFINMEVLNAVGLQPARTYSELRAQVPVLRAAGYDTVIMPNAEAWVMQSCLFSAIAGRFCGEGWEQRIHSGQARFTDPDFVAALQFVRTMYDDGVLNQNTLATEYGSSIGLFATNRGAYMIDGDWRVGDFLTDHSTGQALVTPDRQRNFRISIFPAIDLPGVRLNNNNTTVLATGWAMNANIPSGSDKEAAAWELIKWLTGREAQAFMVETGTFSTPSRTDIDLSRLALEPMQIAIANLGNEYQVATVVIDAAFPGVVYTPLNDGLQAIGMGRQTPLQVAQVVQAAFDAWRAQ